MEKIMALGQLRKLGSTVMKGKPKKGGKGKAGGFTPEQRAYANDTLGADAVKDMERQGFTKEQILKRAKKQGGPYRQFKDRQIDQESPKDFKAGERRARDIKEGGMRSAERPGLRMKKGGVATKKKKSNGLPNGIVPADKYFTKKAYAVGGAVTAIRNVAGTIASKLKKNKNKGALSEKQKASNISKQIKKLNEAQDKLFREKSKTKKKTTK